MRHRHHRNFELCDAIVKLPDGSFTSQEMMHQPRIPWLHDISPINARPDRVKFCPICYRSKPIADFLLPPGPLRTVAKFSPTGEPFAYVAADVSEYCKQCKDEADYLVPAFEDTESF
jgi:hypothetical protein